MSQHYFSTQGAYGDRYEMTEDTEWTIIVPTGKWTTAMWDLIENTEPTKRIVVAKHFNVNVHEIKKEVCKGCNLNAEQLANQWLVGVETHVTPDYSDWTTDAWSIGDTDE